MTGFLHYLLYYIAHPRFNRTETRSRPSVLIARARSLETIELVTAPTFDLISARIFSRTARI